MAKEKFYITTTIPYANAAPHIGHALEFVQADVLARWNRLLGKDVFFLTGTDEHGTKNYQTAKKNGKDPLAFVTENSDIFEKLLKALNCTNDNFIRTTDQKNHWPGVVDMWKKLEKKGDIYKKSYEGNYCSGCERFVTEKDLVDGKCPNHPKLDIEVIAEENYFFRLSKYSDKIRKLVETDKLKIVPEKWKNNFLGLIKDGLYDVSFSRDKKHLPWGIPVPNDPDQVMYVWCDALTNYLTGVGYPDKKHKKYWPADVHVVGKDMLRFHTGIWPGMLLSAGLPLPKEVIVHGFLTVNGEKMSKSTGNVIDPLDLSKNYGADSLRYYFLRSNVFGDDGDFDEKALVDRHNNELGNKLGNLVSRVAGLIEKNGLEKCDNSLEIDFKKIKKLIDGYEFDKALNEIFAFIDVCNEYVQNKKPWETKDKKVLFELACAIKDVAILLSPFIPETSDAIAKKFDFKIDIKEFGKPLSAKAKITKGEILFVRLEQLEDKVGILDKIKVEHKKGKINKDSVVKEIMESNSKNSTRAKGTLPEGVATVKFEDWAKIDLRVGEIEKAEDVPKADLLYKLNVNLGTENRTILSGLKEFYSKDDLQGMKIIVIANLAPRKMRGIMSEGMLLAAVNDDDSKVILIGPTSSDAEPGMKVS